MTISSLRRHPYVLLPYIIIIIIIIIIILIIIIIIIKLTITITLIIMIMVILTVILIIIIIIIIIIIKVFIVFLKVLRVTFLSNHRFNEHIKAGQPVSLCENMFTYRGRPTTRCRLCF